MGMLATLLLALSISALLIHPIVRRLHSNGFLVAAVPTAIAFVVLFALGSSQPLVVESISWLPQIGLDLTFRMDQLSWLFALLVTGAGTLVLVYCRNYFDDVEEGLARFASVFLGFSASMLGLVLADNLFLMFVFWEATSVFSFLLIAHSYRRRTSRSSALQALMVTTAGGLVMLVGLVILATMSGSPNLSDILETPPVGTLATVSVFLILIGALSKSAIFPFHFWLPGAMAAPTPVSAYLHAAAMVKAGIYLIVRLGTGFADVPGYREVLVILGALTMINGGVRALRQHDIKLIIAHGTVSQLGLLVMVIGVGDPRVAYAGLALVFAHALAKAPLFLVVGIIDHRTGTRDLRRLSGLWRQAPGLTAIAVLASFSMMGVPPFIGFVAKEAAFTELLDTGHTLPITLLAFFVALLGSVLTVAYMLRFLWGAFATKRNVNLCTIVHRDSGSTLITPGVFVACTVLGGVFAPIFDSLMRRALPDSGAEHLALWHGMTAAFGASMLVLAAGTFLAFALVRAKRAVPAIPERYSASHVYWLFTHWLDVIAVRVTSLTQRGSLPFYLAVILTVTAATLGGTLVTVGDLPTGMPFFTSPVQIPIAIVMILAALFAMRARTRFQAVILVGITGYGMSAIFVLHGAPDLALTQVLVETVTLIAFVLVIRRLPQRISRPSIRWKNWVRVTIGAAIGLSIGALALIALDARVADPISLLLPELAYTGGHGSNVVNVTLVDVRGWDTLGELSVILAAATGVASLIFLSTRVDKLPKMRRREAKERVDALIRRIEDPNDPTERRSWLLAGRNLDPSRRSILLEVVVRLIFHALILLSFYLLLVGHNAPGGGFAGGLVAGLALVARYLTGGRDELGATVPIDAGRILGAGLALASTMAILPMFFGQAALASVWIDLDLGLFGTLPLVSSTLFDIGVYLVVFGLVLDVLRSLGAEIDRQEESDHETALRENVTWPGGPK